MYLKNSGNSETAH